MDIDLAYELKDLLHLVRAVQNGASIATGSRYDSRSVVERGLKRSVLSQGYRRMVRWLLKSKTDDFQSGFKFINREVKKFLPNVKDTRWFFDTEPLVLAEKAGHSIAQLPVTCVQGKTTKVNILQDARLFTQNLFRFQRRLRNEGLL